MSLKDSVKKIRDVFDNPNTRYPLLIDTDNGDVWANAPYVITSSSVPFGIEPVVKWNAEKQCIVLNG